MKWIRRAWASLTDSYLGGSNVSTLGSVQGQSALGSNPDLLKASGEIRVHRVTGAANEALVTLELMQHEVPGDAAEMLCVRLRPADAERLGDLLSRAAEPAVESSVPAPARL